jgi:hypothetical protein
MKRTDRVIEILLILTFTTVLLSGCISSIATDTPESPFTPVQSRPAPVILESPNPAYANAQATKDAGQNQLLDLARKSTEIGLDMSKAANSAAAATQDYNRRQKMELDYQSTVVSLNIAQANATQKAIAQQTQIAKDATAAAQNTAAAATRSANLINLTQTARAQLELDAQDRQTVQAAAALTAYPITATYSAQLILDAQAAQAVQALATLKAYPLTATPLAATQAALLMQQYDREQQSFIKRVVTPMIPILVIVDLLLLTLGLVLAYRRMNQAPRLRTLRMQSANIDPGPMVMIDGVIVDHDPRPNPKLPPQISTTDPVEPPSLDTVHVEIANASEAPFAHWIAEVEHQLGIEGGLR